MTTAESYWQDMANRRKFFMDYATENNFDPLLPENWYNVSSYKIKERKVY